MSMELNGPDVAVRPFAVPSSPAVLVLRALIALGLVVGMAQTASAPTERPVDDLLMALQDGDVTTLTIERPEPGTSYAGSLRVEWSGAGWSPSRPWPTIDWPGGRSAYTSYEYARPTDGESDGTSDTGELILSAAESSPSPVDITVQRGHQPRPGITWHILGLAGLAGLILLIAGPQPRLATKWAWFWLGAITPLWVAWVLLEPVPLWRKEPMEPSPRRLTGGWAFLIALLAGALAASIVPEYADVLTG